MLEIFFLIKHISYTLGMLVNKVRGSHDTGATKVCPQSSCLVRIVVRRRTWALLFENDVGQNETVNGVRYRSIISFSRNRENCYGRRVVSETKYHMPQIACNIRRFI